MAKLYELLEIRPGVTALIGSGGKTGLLYTLAGELYKKSTVVVATTTHMWQPKQFPLATTMEELKALLQENPIVCVGSFSQDGKLGIPAFEGWDTAADYTIVEADGARMLPLKAHAPHEPVIPAGCENVICVVGASGFDKPIVQVVHRPEIFMSLVGVQGRETMVSPQMAAEVIRKEHLCTRIFVNQTDALPKFFGGGKVKDFARAVDVPVVSGSLRQGLWQKVK